MSRQMLPVMLVLTILTIAAMVIAAYLLLFAGAAMAAISGAILLLAICVLATGLAMTMKLGKVEDWLYSHDETLRDLAGRSDRAAARLSELEHQVNLPTPGIDKLITDLSALRQEVKDAMLRKSEANAAAATARPEAPRAADEPMEPEHLDLLLEPVIELSSGSTSHYRALVSLANSRGEVVPSSELMDKADLGGMRPALDAHMVKLVAPVLRRLRLKNPGLRVFVPLGLATLGSRVEADSIIALLLRDSDVANGMVFELGQDDIGQLDPTGIENLARLGRLGATLALRDVYLGGLDLTALRQLGVRFLNFPPHAVDAGNGPSEVWREFVQYARAMQIQLIVGGIDTPQQAASASKCARFGHGSFFAPPRKVRRDAGVAAAGRRASVA
ncbi:MAG: EAL domain-containing protein [Aestuariivirga sp.]|nr:EAL domain-containing protein [Aestuariivirga sp.]